MKMIEKEIKFEKMLNRKVKTIGFDESNSNLLYNQGNLLVNSMAQSELGNAPAFEGQKMMPLQKQLGLDSPKILEMDNHMGLEQKKFVGIGKKAAIKQEGFLGQFPMSSKKIRMIGQRE